jgi:crotonobetaine/carnitine-CoA ligase
MTVPTASTASTAMYDATTETPVLERTVACVLAKQVAARPDKAALIDVQGGTLTFAQVSDSAYRIANAFHQVGVQRQEFVLTMLDNHIDTALTWLGLNVGAFAAVPINTAYKGQILAHVAANSGARTAVVEGQYCDRLAAVIDEIPALETVFVHGEPNAPLPARVAVRDFAELLAAAPVAPAEPARVSDISTVIYTSGTEGASKGVLCPHGHTFQMSAAFRYPTTDADVVMVNTPLFHAMGLLTGIYTGLRGGATVVLPGPFSVSGFWNVVREYGVTQTVIVGAMADFLWRQPPAETDTEHTLRNMIVVPAVPYLQDFGKRFNIEVWSAYGQTETGITTLTDPGDARPFLCGRPRPFIQMKLVDDDDVEVEQGQVGEIVVRSTEPWTMFRGYHEMPEATVGAWRNLWMHTGDSAYKDADDRYFFVDRKKDALRCRGENVSSLEVEGCIAQQPGIALAAVVAVRGESSEDEIKAYLQPQADHELDLETLLRNLVDRLPYFMVPRYYEIVDALPLTPQLKVQKARLRELPDAGKTWDCQAHGLTVTRHGLKETR